MTHQPLLTDPRMAQLGRLKPLIVPPEPGDLVRLPLIRKALVYKRLSTHEQRKKSIWSLEMQDALFELAKADGYREDQIIVEDRDLGISGTKGPEDRPGLAALIAAIEADTVETVYVVHISRISRDQTLIDGLEFGELCKQHRVLIVMPTMRLNLRDSMHLRLYRQEIERAADEIELLKLRLGGPLRHKALSGRYDGRGVAVGYLLDHDKHSERYERYTIYESHAEVVRAIFRAVLATGTPTRAARWLRDQGISFRPFGADVPREDVTRCSLARSKNPLDEHSSVHISPPLVQSIVTNPVYLGWWLVGGQVVHTDNHRAIIDEETFLRAQELLAQHGHRRVDRVRLTELGPQLLSGILWCGQHGVPQRMGGSFSEGQRRYLCHHQFANAQADHYCTVLDARILDEPLTDFVLRCCSFAEHAAAVLTRIEAEYDTARDEARRRQRELAHLQQEVETYKHNLGLTRSPEQVTLLFEQIDQRMARIRTLADERNSPVGRVLSVAQVETVKAFLADLRMGWDKQPYDLRNELFRLLLERVVIEADAEQLAALVVWRGGAQQRLWIERARIWRAGKSPWSAADHTWLREHYATATPAQLQAQFPSHSTNAIRQQARKLRITRLKRSAPPPKKMVWGEEENRVLRAYATAAISYAELVARLPGRSWDAIWHQASTLGLRLRDRPICYRILEDVRVPVSSANHSGAP